MNIDILKPGDCLLYRPTDLIGWIIAIKTWSKVCHVEVYAGNGMSWASRNGIGVNLYALRTADLCEVRRPYSFDVKAAQTWFNTVRGQAYDFLGLCCFYLAVKSGASDRMFCSEFALNLYRNAGAQVLAEECVPDHTAPSEFIQTSGLQTIWSEVRESKAIKLFLLIAVGTIIGFSIAVNYLLP
jgi:hypothetical protein